MKNYRWCHASCCSGETQLDEAWCSHDAQMILDSEGSPYGSYGNEHPQILEFMVKAYKNGHNDAVGMLQKDLRERWFGETDKD